MSEASVTLTEAEIQDVCDMILGYVDGEAKAHMKYEQLQHVDLEELLLNHNIERCPTCGMFVESHELVDCETGDVIELCDNCRK